MDNSISISRIKSVINAPSLNIQRNWPLIEASLDKFDILTKNTAISAIGTTQVETGVFAPINEFGSHSYFLKRYESRKDLGNVNPGDGYKYHGRGFIQITGRANYRFYGEALKVDLENNPELALNPLIASDILAKYFKDKKINIYSESKNWLKIRKLVNGGLNGFEQFKSICEKLSLENK